MAPAAESWHGEPAFRLTSGDGSRLVIVPGRGAKIVSLTDPTGLERLAQPRLPVPPPSRPGDRFVEAEMCGWDECAPAVLEGVASVGGREVVVPDHGELWTAPWTCSRDGDGVVAVAEGPSQGYLFQRTVEPTENGFRLRYDLRAGDRPVAMCWVAHPQFTAPAGSRVDLPGVRTAVDVLDPQRPRRPWPAGGVAVDDVPAGGCSKVYAAPEHPTGRARLSTPGRASLVLSWDASTAPYCGVWVDRGAYSREDVVAVEPATGFADGLDDAVGSGRVLTVAARGQAGWWLEVGTDAS